MEEKRSLVEPGPEYDPKLDPEKVPTPGTSPEPSIPYSPDLDPERMPNPGTPLHS